METRSRTVAKAVSWQLLGLIIMSGLGWWFTGSISAGGAMAAVSALIGLVSYVLHERAWGRVTWGRRA